MEEKVKAFLQLATEKKASDIFIIAGRPLSVKIDGKLCTLEGFEERLMPLRQTNLSGSSTSLPMAETSSLCWNPETMTSPWQYPDFPDSV